MQLSELSSVKLSLPGLSELRHSKAHGTELRIPLRRNQELRNASVDWKSLSEVDTELIKSVEASKSDVTIQLDQEKLIRDGFKSLLDVKLTEKPENIIVEFSSPNIAKPFHMGECSKDTVMIKIF